MNVCQVTCATVPYVGESLRELVREQIIFKRHIIFHARLRSTTEHRTPIGRHSQIYPVARECWEISLLR